MLNAFLGEAVFDGEHSGGAVWASRNVQSLCGVFLPPGRSAGGGNGNGNKREVGPVAEEEGMGPNSFHMLFLIKANWYLKSS